MTLVPAISRLVGTYGSFAFDAANGITISSEFANAETWLQWARTGVCRFRFNVTLASETGVVATDDTAYAALLAAVESNLTIPRQRLLLKVMGATILDWDWTGGFAGTAFGIKPEITRIRENGRDSVWEFAVKAEFPGNVPGNNFRRESSTQTGFGLSQRQICVMSAEWTTGGGNTAVQNYVAHRNAFFAAYLPANTTDQFGTGGVWTLAFSDQGPWDDEVAKITVRRVYWEVFAGRQEARIELDEITTGTSLGTSQLEARRVCRIPSRWAADTVSGNTALQNYLANGETYFGNALPANISGGTWVLVDANPSWSDEDSNSGFGVLNVLHTYREVDDTGNWEYHVSESFNDVNARVLTVSGTYYPSGGNTAKQNYTANIGALLTAVTTASGITRSSAKTVPAYEGYDTPNLTYRFTRTIHEIIYQQNGSGYADNNLTLETIDLKNQKPFLPMSQTTTITVQRLNTVKAIFTGKFDSQVNVNPTAYWESTLRAFVLTQITSHLGAGVTSVMIVDEDVGPIIGDQQNTFSGTLWLIVLGGSILSLRMIQRHTRRSIRDFVGMGDGTPQSYFAYYKVPFFQEELFREAWCEWIVGGAGTPPVLFATGDLTPVSGVNFIDPGVNAPASLTLQAAANPISQTTGWFCELLVEEIMPTDRGTGAGSPYETCVSHTVENWFNTVLVASAS